MEEARGNPEDTLRLYRIEFKAFLQLVDGKLLKGLNSTLLAGCKGLLSDSEGFLEGQ